MSKRIPTKDEELAILDKAIAELGLHSYLGPWLTQVRDEAEWQAPLAEWDHNQLEALPQAFVLTHVTDSPEDFKETLYYQVAESDAASAGWRTL